MSLVPPFEPAPVNLGCADEAFTEHPAHEATTRLLRETVRHREHEVHLLNTAVHELSAQINGEDLYRTSLALVLRLLPFSGGMLFTYDDERSRMTLRASQGFALDVEDRFRQWSVSASDADPLSHAVRHRSASVITAARHKDFDRLRDALGRHDMNAVIVRPLLARQEPIGALLVCTAAESGPFGDTDLLLLDHLCDALSLAIGEDVHYERKLDRVRAELISLLSHELRTPLTSILGFAEILAEGEAGELTSEQRSCIEIIDASAQRLHRHVENLLTLATLQNGAEPARVLMTSQPVAQALQAVVQSHRKAAVARGLSLRFRSEGLQHVLGNTRDIEAVLGHLVENAVKFAPVAGRIEITARALDDTLRVAVFDDGPQIPASERTMLFTAFYRTAAAARDAVQGAGLGLAIAHGLVERLGGRIWLEDERTGGKRFCFEVPLSTLR